MEKVKKQELESLFVGYKQALILKELGFDEPCLFHILGGKINFYRSTQDYFPKNDRNGIGCSAILYQQAFKFFREKHNWQHSIEPTADQHSHQLGYNYWIWNYKTKEEYHTMPKNRPSGDWEYKTYEEAEQACLDKLIEICKTKTND